MPLAMKRRRLQARDYTIGWICALPIELAAAQEMLDEEDDSPTQDNLDPNLYTLGRIGDHNVVLTSLPAGQTGTHPAATVAARMKSKFTSIRFGLMVGIGGGVPSAGSDIQLGDVVISQPYLQHGGVVQYDFGKTGAGGYKTRTGWLNAPPAVLLNAISQLRALHYRDRSSLATYLSAFNRLERFSRNMAGPDILFEATYDHIGGATCERCNKEKEVKRTPRKGQDVVIHCGTIASGNQVIKNGIARDRLSAELGGVMCFEMEAAGLMNDFPCLIIRGICDYADSHKNKTWQPYAAATAAACAKEILSIIPAVEVARTVTVDEADYGQTSRGSQFSVPFPRNNRFVGRASHLEILEKKVFAKSRRERIAIYGLGGVGKTQVVLELAYRTKEREPTCSIFWIQASSAEKVKQAYLDIGQALQIPGISEEKADVKQLVKQKLSQENAGEWLLILDNADDADMWFKEANNATSSGSLVSSLPRSSTGSIIWTTRDRKAALKMASAQDILEIREMDESVASDLLRKSLIHPEVVDVPQIRTQLLNQLTYLPLAITQAVAYINANEMSIVEYLSLLEEAEETTVEMLSEDFEDEGRYRDLKNPVATTWLISFQQIRQRNALAAEYLSFMSCLDANKIPQSILPPAPNKKAMTDAIGTLSAYSFIDKRAASSLTTNTSADNQTFDLHRLVRLATRNWLRAENKLRQWAESAMTRLADIFPTDEHMNKAIWTAYVPHALSICFSDLVDKNITERSTLLGKVGLCLQAEGRYKEAERPIVEALQARIEFLGNEHPDTLTSVSNLGSVLERQGKYKEAEAMHQRALEAKEKVLGREHLDTLVSVNNLGSVLFSQGKYEEAKAMHRRALEGREKILGQEHLSTLASVNNLGLVLLSQGKYEEAEVMHRRTLEAREKALGREHLDTLASVSNLGLVLSRQGKYKEAEAMHWRDLEGSEKALGQEHPDTLASVSNLGRVLLRQSKYKEAEAMHRRALEGSEKVLGREHPDTLASVNNLGLVLESQGRYEEAEAMHRRALEGSEKVLGREHPDTLASVNNLGSVLLSQGRYKEAEAMHQRALEAKEKVLGREHPDTLLSVNNLGLVLLSQGRYKEAEAIHQRALEAEEKMLGREHSGTLASVSNLGSVLLSQGRYEEAEVMPPIKFKDAIGRKFSFPWHLCKTWKGMEDIIKLAFLHVDVIGPHVHEGHYDLVGPDGEIILRQVWETIVQPDWAITMHMWPMPEPPEPPPPPPMAPPQFVEVPPTKGKARPKKKPVLSGFLAWAAGVGGLRQSIKRSKKT